MKLINLEKKFAKDLRPRKYNRDDLALDVGLLIIGVRIKAGLTQEELAKKMGTKQSSIARVENGYSLASLDFLNKLADVLNFSLELPKFNLRGEVARRPD